MARMLKLRDYQKDCLKSLKADFDRGYQSLLIQGATGSGKTIMFLAWLNSYLDEDDRALVLSHRSELVSQPLDKARQFFPDLYSKMGIVKADQNDAAAQVVVATVQTLNSNGRLAEVLSHGAFDLYIVDEAHHDTASTYRFVEKALHDANPELLKSGWTATVCRTDKNGLVTSGEKIGPYEKLSFRYPVPQAVRDGALCEFSAFACGIPVSVSNISETQSGWNNELLGDILNCANVWEIVLSAWRGKLESAPNCSKCSTVAFTSSVSQAHGGAEYFRDHDITAEAVDGKTPSDERKAMLLERFQDGTTQAIFSCGVLTEGFDAPSASCGLMISPTKSPLVWVQKAGRVLRLNPNDENKKAIIIDFYPQERTNVFAADALGVPKRITDAKEKAEEVGVMIGGWSVDRFGRSVSINTDRIVFRMLDLMSKSRLPWSLNGHLATTALTKDTAACIVLPDPDRLEKAEELRRGDGWTDRHEAIYDHIRRVRLYTVFRKHEKAPWKAELINHYDDPDSAKAHVDIWPSDPQLGSRSAGWRKNTVVSVRHERYLRRLVPDAPEGLTRGETSRLISEALTITAAKRAEKIEELRLWQKS